MNAQELINEIKKLQTYKLSEHDSMILIEKEEVISIILQYFIHHQSNSLKLIIGD